MGRNRGAIFLLLPSKGEAPNPKTKVPLGNWVYCWPGMSASGGGKSFHTHLAVGQNQWYHFGAGAPPILVYFSGDWAVFWGYDLDFAPWPSKLGLPMAAPLLFNREYFSRRGSNPLAMAPLSS